MNISGIKENLDQKKLKENKVKNNNRGITLIALIITIIVLLILAGISISLVVGQNGVLTRSQQASTRTKESQAQEAFELAFAAPEADYHQQVASGEIPSSTGESDWITLQKISDNLSTDYKLCDSSGAVLTDLTKNVTSTKDTGIYMKKDGQVYKVTYQIISGVPTNIVAKIYDKSSEEEQDTGIITTATLKEGKAGAGDVLKNATSYQKGTKELYDNAVSSGTTINVISTEDSEYPVYEWTDTNQHAYWYSEAKKVYLNSKSSYMFMDCQKLETIDLSGFDTSNVTDLSWTFLRCYKLKELDLSNFNTENVTTMEGMFNNCTAIQKIDVSKFNTQNVTSMGMMFKNCYSLKDIDLSVFDTSNVEWMNNMFSSCTVLTEIDVSNFDTSNVKNMMSMFYGLRYIKSLDLSNFNTKNVKNMDQMFNGCQELTTIFAGDNWSVDNVEKSSLIFNKCSKLTNFSGDGLNHAYYGGDGKGYLTYKASN